MLTVEYLANELYLSPRYLVGSQHIEIINTPHFANIFSNFTFFTGPYRLDAKRDADEVKDATMML